MITLPNLDTTRANCGPATADLFHSTDPNHEQQALDLCAACPLRAACAQWALDTREQHGTWGGLTASDRHRIQHPDEDTWIDSQGRVRRPCGTQAALQAHLRLGETCETCRRAQARRTEERRRAQLAAEHAAGGTVLGAAIHRRLGEATCALCRRAQARQSAAQREARQGRTRRAVAA